MTRAILQGSVCQVINANEKKSGGGTLFNGLCGKVSPERGIFFRLEVYKRVGISRVEIQKKDWENRPLGILKETFEISRTGAPNG